MALLNFNAAEVTPDSGVLDPLPEGWYNVLIDDSEISPTKNGDGAFLRLRFKVADGSFTGRSVYGRYNIRNANEVAQRIALGQLSAIAHAVGVINVVDSTMLHNIPLKIRVKILQDEGYAPTNDIIAYKNINEAVATVTAAPVATLPPAAPVLQPIPAVIPPAMGVPPAILGQAPVQAWAVPAPAAPAPLVAPVAPAPLVAPVAVAPVAVPVAPVAVAPAPVAEPVVDATFDPSQPPAWMTK